MKKLIYQVYVHNESNLYNWCTESVVAYCRKYNIDHIIQTEPILRIKPNVIRTNRSPESYGKYGGYLPIYEKENAFDYFKEYDQIAIIDADIYIRDTAPNIFKHLDPEVCFGGVIEKDMPLSDKYVQKVINYSNMQYVRDGRPILNMPYNAKGAAFFNMGMMVMNKSITKYINGSAREFLERTEFQDFVDGIGPYKWSTDQTLLNTWLRKYNIPVQNMDWRWNGLYKGIRDGKINECNFIHFFLRDKLPGKGENIEELKNEIHIS